jgi:hypothetical protein
VKLAALQARALSNGCAEREMAEVAARGATPSATLRAQGDFGGEDLAEPDLSLRKHDCPRSRRRHSRDRGRRWRAARWRPAWIRGIDHRIEPHQPGYRDLTTSPSTKLAGEKAGAAGKPLDLAELHAPFTHQELILRRALALPASVAINPSGGPLAANPMMAAGLARIGEAARPILEGQARRALAHATQGHCLQQNLVCVLEGE